MQLAPTQDRGTRFGDVWVVKGPSRDHLKAFNEATAPMLVCLLLRYTEPQTTPLIDSKLSIVVCDFLWMCGWPHQDLYSDGLNRHLGMLSCAEFKSLPSALLRFVKSRAWLREVGESRIEGSSDSFPQADRGRLPASAGFEGLASLARLAWRLVAQLRALGVCIGPAEASLPASFPGLASRAL